MLIIFITLQSFGHCDILDPLPWTGNMAYQKKLIHFHVFYVVRVAIHVTWQISIMHI